MSDLRARQQTAEMVSNNDNVNQAGHHHHNSTDNSDSLSSSMNHHSSVDIMSQEENESSHFLDNGSHKGQECNARNDFDLGSSNSSSSSSKSHDTTYIHFFGQTFNKILLMAHLNVFMYSTCFWIQNAVFPYLSKSFGADPVTFGYLQTTFAVVQLAGGPLFGRFGDTFGSRLAMMFAFLASATSYFTLYMATSIPLLFLSRLPSIFMHAMQGGQMIVTDVCDTKGRAKALAKLGLSYGLGMVVGTLTGGTIARLFSLETGALVACIGSLISAFLIYTSIPAKVKRTLPAADQRQESIFSVSKISQLLKSPGALFLMSIKLGTGIPIGIFQSMFGIIALETFKLPAHKNSYMMTYVGLLSMMVQGIAVGQATKRYSDLVLLTASAALLSVSYFAMSFVTSVWQMCIVFLPLVTGLTFQTVITTSALTNTVSNTDTGAMLGMSMAVNSLIRTVSPTIGGYMFRSLGFSSFGQLGFITTSTVTVVLLLKLRRERL